jgi:hypothetical protein
MGLTEITINTAPNGRCLYVGSPTLSLVGKDGGRGVVYTGKHGSTTYTVSLSLNELQALIVLANSALIGQAPLAYRCHDCSNLYAYAYDAQEEPTCTVCGGHDIEQGHTPAMQAQIKGDIDMTAIAKQRQSGEST